jgi:ribosome maturation factor RimP
VERRLTRPEHFKRSLGAEIRVVAQQGFHEGRLVSVSEDGIWIDNIFLSFSAIKHARLKIATEELFRRER